MGGGMVGGGTLHIHTHTQTLRYAQAAEEMYLAHSTGPRRQYTSCYHQDAVSIQKTLAGENCV